MAGMVAPRTARNGSPRQRGAQDPARKSARDGKKMASIGYCFAARHPLKLAHCPAPTWPPSSVSMAPCRCHGRGSQRPVKAKISFATGRRIRFIKEENGSSRCAALMKRRASITS